MTDPQPSDAEARILAELEAEHDDRKRRFAEKRERSRVKRERRAERKTRDAELSLRNKLQEEFYQDKGYKKYVDSRGKTHWLLPEEYEFRVKARAERERRRGKYRAFEKPGRANWMVWAGMVLLAIVMGFALLQQG